MEMQHVLWVLAACRSAGRALLTPVVAELLEQWEKGEKKVQQARLEPKTSENARNDDQRS